MNSYPHFPYSSRDVSGIRSENSALHIMPFSTSRFQGKCTFLREVNRIEYTCVPLNLQHLKVQNALMHCVCYVTECIIYSLVKFARRKPLIISYITIG
jgi:hypothetical protein